MSIIIDRRNTKSSKNSSNRSRFVKRYKKHLQKNLDKIMRDKNIEDANKPVDVPIDWSTREEDIGFDTETGEYESIYSGNDQFKKGDKIEKDEEEANSGTGGEDEEDSYMFTLTKEEFFDLYFDDMELPDFVKKSMIDITKNQYRRAGFIKDGIPARLDVLKTIQMSIARRISCKNTDKKPPFLDDVDLRFKHYVNDPKPMLKAVIFFCMDVSGSMEEHHKLLSKKFFILFYLFLVKNYELVDIRFIRYHHEASDVTEKEFFYSRETGGTEVLEGLQLIKSIILDEYPPHIYNIYIAHTSDGDTGWHENEKIVNFLDSELMDLVQYYAYIQVQTGRQYEQFQTGITKLYGILEESIHIHKKLNIDNAVDMEDVFPVLHNLFKKEK